MLDSCSPYFCLFNQNKESEFLSIIHFTDSPILWSGAGSPLTKALIAKAT